MPQCISCNKCSMQERGNCVCLLDETREVRKSLTVHQCNNFKLAPMDSVKSRTKRKMIFDDKDVAKIVNLD